MRLLSDSNIFLILFWFVTSNKVRRCALVGSAPLFQPDGPGSIPSRVNFNLYSETGPGIVGASLSILIRAELNQSGSLIGDDQIMFPFSACCPVLSADRPSVSV